MRLQQKGAGCRGKRKARTCSRNRPGGVFFSPAFEAAYLAREYGFTDVDGTQKL